MLSQLLGRNGHVVNAACALRSDLSIIASCRVQVFVLVSVGFCVVMELSRTDRRRCILVHRQRHTGQVHVIHSVAQNSVILTQPLDLSPGLGSLAASVYIERNAGFILVGYVGFQSTSLAQGQLSLGSSKSVLYLSCTLGSDQGNADPVPLGLGGVAVGVLFQVCSGDSDLSIIVAGLSFRCLSCLDSVAVLVVQVSNGSLRLVSQTSGVNRLGLSGRDGEGTALFRLRSRQTGLQESGVGLDLKGTARDLNIRVVVTQNSIGEPSVARNL